jgi:ribosomal protein L9
MGKVISLERHSHVGEIRGLYVIKKGYCQNSSMLENVIGSITDQEVKTLKTNEKRQLERRRSGETVHKNISEIGCDKGKWTELVQNFCQRRHTACVELH